MREQRQLLEQLEDEAKRESAERKLRRWFGARDPARALGLGLALAASADSERAKEVLAKLLAECVTAETVCDVAETISSSVAGNVARETLRLWLVSANDTDASFGLGALLLHSEKSDETELKRLACNFVLYRARNSPSLSLMSVASLLESIAVRNARSRGSWFTSGRQEFQYYPYAPTLRS